MAGRLGEIIESPDAERLATGFIFTEGHLWHPDGYLPFVDIRTSRIYRLTPSPTCLPKPTRTASPTA